METFILHISDLHFVRNAPAYNTEEILREEAKAKVKDIPQGHKLLIVTGDFHNYNDNDYSKSEKFLTDLAQDMGLDMTKDVFVVPGNHDVGNDNTLMPLLQKKDPDWKNHSKAAIAAIKNGEMSLLADRLCMFRVYSDFVRRLGIYNSENNSDAPAATHVRSWRGKLNILHLNTAIIADGEKSEDGKRPDQMTDTDTAARSETWSSFTPAQIPAIAIAHNSYYDLQEQQRNELAAIFYLKNIRAYLCGDRHRTEKDPQQQIIRIESGHKRGEEIPNLVAAKTIADRDDKYSEVGFCWHKWNEETGKVTVEFRKWTPYNLAKTVLDGDIGEYDLGCKKTPETVTRQILDKLHVIELEGNVASGSRIIIISSRFNLDSEEELTQIIIRNIRRGCLYQYVFAKEDQDDFLGVCAHWWKQFQADLFNRHVDLRKLDESAPEYIELKKAFLACSNIDVANDLIRKAKQFFLRHIEAYQYSELVATTIALYEGNLNGARVGAKYRREYQVIIRLPSSSDYYYLIPKEEKDEIVTIVQRADKFCDETNKIKINDKI